MPAALAGNVAVPSPAAADGLAVDASRSDVTGRLVRGVLRFFRTRSCAALAEVNLGNGRRADVLAIDRGGIVAIVEVKSSPEDFRSDHKWHHYLAFCDWFAFAVGLDFPVSLLPAAAAVLIADDYGAVMVRPPADRAPLSPGRRKSLMLTFAHVAANRLAVFSDPLDPHHRGGRRPFVPTSR